MTAAIVDAARAAQPTLQKHLQEVHDGGRLPPAVVEALREAGVYRMMAPAAVGGDPVDLPTFLEVLEAVGEGCGAAGWNLATSSAVALSANWLPPSSLAHVYSRGPDVPFAGSAAPPNGRASEVDDGFRVTG